MGSVRGEKRDVHASLVKSRIIAMTRVEIQSIANDAKSMAVHTAYADSSSTFKRGGATLAAACKV